MGASIMVTRRSSCHVVPSLGLQVALSLAMFPKPIPCTGDGSRSLVGRLPSSKRPSRLACWELPRRTRSKRTLTTRRQVACICASISSGTSAQSMPPLPSTLVPSALGGLAITSTSHWSRMATFLASGSSLRNTAKLASSGRWTRASASELSAVPSPPVHTPSCGSPPRSRVRFLSSSTSRCPTTPSRHPSLCRAAISQLWLVGTMSGLPQEKGYLVGQERERDGSATWIGGFHLPLGQRSFVDLHSNVAADVNSSSVS